ncbi:MAG: DNA mismatch repair protein MutS [Bacteroidales bacterium]|nr:DNA mismatch repair protein MutS [Bacteroidales bacterium]
MTSAREIVETPLMKQYNSIKAKYPDAVLLFRVGDFYETFGEDAVRASKILGIVLTKRANGAASFVDLAGFPHHSLDLYLPRLVRAGVRVAICEQLEDPKKTKKIVKRGVTELVTPGVAFNDNVLDGRNNNFLGCIHLQGTSTGLALMDVTTGEFYVSQGSPEYIDKLLQSLRPKEIILQKNKREEFERIYGSSFYLSTFDEWVFTFDYASNLLLRHFNTLSLKGFGVEDMHGGIIAAGAALHYLNETHHDKTSHIVSLSRIDEDEHVWLDKFTIRNLELVESMNEKAVTLLDVLDRTESPMGSRMIRKWIVLPLRNRETIEERQDVVSYFISQTSLSETLKQEIRRTGDLERLTGKASVGKISPRELLQIFHALTATGKIMEYLSVSVQPALKRMGERLNTCASIRDMIRSHINEEPPAQIGKGAVIAAGVSDELDEIRDFLRNGKDYLIRIQQREIENTGISSLKIGYNTVFGYYLEVTHTHRNKVPDNWIRKQTLTHSERYITEELKEYEQKILGAEEKILKMEQQLYDRLVMQVAEFADPMLLNAHLIATLDVLLSFATVSGERNYCRPDLDDSFVLDIRKGRHPVIETQMPPGEEYVPNDLTLDNEKQQIIILTGPNMSGKSALLRQTALITLMAQTGCHVPAEKASIGLVDKIFTRVGASDNISSGESTFLVEMNETASILNNISNRSLILLDEIGRGTSTYDGISIAWAIAEYIHEHPLFRAKVLFATHYHELNEMSMKFGRIKNFHISIKEVGNRVIFLRKLQPGGSEHSFGIHVARMAGMPDKLLKRAEEILTFLENSHSQNRAIERKAASRTIEPEGFQLSFIQLEDPLLIQIRDDIINTDVNTLTPVEALLKLHEIKKILGK